MQLARYLRTALTLLLFGGMVCLLFWLVPPESRGGAFTAGVAALSSLGAYAAGKSAYEKKYTEPPK